jgi:hypothetical protein
MAKDRQSSADAQATAPALRGSPTLTMGLGGSYSFHRLDEPETNWGQAIHVRHAAYQTGETYKDQSMSSQSSCWTF